MTFLFSRDQLEERELKMLPSYALCNRESKGRDFLETPSSSRLDFQRDRDRVLHSKAFRRLKGKTQVFVSHHGDHFRSRLTHTLEVAQIARSLARTLKCNEDLAETIALAHDLGHTPFGHSGEEAMRDLMHRYGEIFEHNAQSRRIVEKLEKRSSDYNGLNLTFESREGLWKHVSPHDKQLHKLSENSFLEAQIVDAADQIAYQNHDIDDGLRSGIISLEEMEKLEIWKQASEGVKNNSPEEIRVFRSISSLINLMVTDLEKETEKRLSELDPKSPDDIRNTDQKVVAFSLGMEEMNHHLRHFLYSKLYRSEEVMKQSTHGQETVKKLFFHLMDHPEDLPKNHRAHIDAGEKPEVVVKDFIAGMTDSFALEMVESIGN